jgi:hypothetical protein
MIKSCAKASFTNALPSSISEGAEEESAAVEAA